MDKISIKLTRNEWIGLSRLVLTESSVMKETKQTSISDRYMQALLINLLKQVYEKLHNKLHSLRETKNTLNISLAEAAAFNVVFADEDYTPSSPFAWSTLTSIIGQIDKKLA